MKIGRKTRYVVLVAIAVPALTYLALIACAPRVGGNLGTGLALLDITGAGYEIGDVVWLKATPQRYEIGDTVLYDWEQVDGPGGFGPACALGTVFAPPGETVNCHLQPAGGMAIEVGDKRMENCYFRGSHAWQGAPPGPGQMTLAAELLLLRVPLYPDRVSTNQIVPVRRCDIKARICFKVGHDPFRARRLRNTVY